MFHLNPSRTESVAASLDTSFRDGRQPRFTDIYIIVMGLTGVGKSSFISRCSKKKPRVGHELEGCTQRVDFYPCEYSADTTVYLVDTPGFDDTNRKDVDVLREITDSLNKTYARGIKPHGVVYLHRITDPRMTGSAWARLYMFEKLVGPKAMKNVTLATTMWETVDPNLGVSREKELKENSKYWAGMIAKGSGVVRLMNNRKSAMHIIDIYASELSTKTPRALEIQVDMVKNHMKLSDTKAGKTLTLEIQALEKRHKEELEQIRAELKNQDQEAAKTLKRYRKETKKELKRLEQDRDKLKVKFEELDGKFRAGSGRAVTPTIASTSVIMTPSTKTKGTAYSIALSGGNYVFLASTGWRANMITTLGLEDSKVSFMYVALGENASWYKHYHRFSDQQCFTYYHLPSYPTLSSYLGYYQAYGCPTCVSLGPSGRFFVRIGDHVFWLLEQHVLDHLRDINQVRKLWLGASGAYVALFFDGSTKWDLRHGYGSLESYLETRKYGTLKTLTLNNKNLIDWAYVTETGGVAWQGANFFCDAFKRWSIESLGVSL